MQRLIDTGFDGWALKPVDFKRLDKLVAGLTDPQLREMDVYRPKKWEQGGWFRLRESLD